MVLYAFGKIISSSGPATNRWLFFIVAAFLLMISKFQIFLLVIPLLTAWVVSTITKHHTGLVFTAICAIFCFVILVAGLIIPELDMITLLSKKQAAFMILAESTGAGSAIEIPVLEPNLSSFLLNAPQGFFTALTRPFITDRGAFLTIVSGMENTIILVFCIICAAKFNTKYLAGKAITWFFLFYILINFTLIGSVTPILGAIVRYKAHVLPFLVIMFVIISTSEEKSIFRSSFHYIKNKKWK